MRAHSHNSQWRLFLVPLFFLLASVLPEPANSSQIYLTSAQYGANSSVVIEVGQVSYITGCPGGFIDDFIYPWADFYVVPQGSTALADVSNATGVPNTLQYVIIDEVIANTGPGGYLISGDYSVLVDECQDGEFQAGIDASIADFSVRIPADIDPLASAAFAAQLNAAKASAEAMGEYYVAAAASYAALFAAYNAIQLYSIATDPADFLLFACTNINMDTGTVYCSLNDAWAGLIKLETAVVFYVANQAFYYKGIAADPPDSDFKTLPVMDQGLQVATTHQPAWVQAALLYGELASQERALTHSLLQAMERYQGAEQAGFGEYAYVQAREIEKHARTLAALLPRSTAAFTSAATQAAAAGVDFVTIMGSYRATQARVIASGLTSLERTKLLAAGWNDAQIAEGVVDYTTRDFTGFQSGTELTDLAAAIAAEAVTMGAALTNLADVMVVAQADLDTQLRLPFPQAVAGGPYIVNEGAPLALAGSAVLADSATPAYSWDLDLDGDFDDASGETPMVSFTKEYDGYIGLKVTLPNGYYDISYARLTVNNLNRSPVVTSSTPSGPVTIPYNGSQNFTVAATDPDNDPLTYSWDLDGTVVGTGNSYAFTATMSAVGEHILTVTVNDASPLSPPTQQMWRMTVTGVDADGDGFPSTVDCNDGSASVSPGAAEIYFNGIDDDCNPATPDNPDGDGDGYDYTVDCNDANPLINPGAIEICDGVDQNCNGQVDEGLLITYYRDADSDGYGTLTLTTQACAQPAGYLADSTDCNDADAAIHPGAPEVCNIKDDNCNGQIDEGVSILLYADGDGDGYGNPVAPVQACGFGPGLVTDNTDCNDASAAVNPGATEVYYDGIDNDCNPATPDGIDADGDLYADNVDCNDADPSVNPGRHEIKHNGKDDDCNPATRDNWSQGFIIASDDSSYLYYAKSNGDGTFSSYKNLGRYFSGNGRGVIVEDFTGDGSLDFLATNGSGEIFLFVNDGADNFLNTGVVARHSTASYVIGMGAGDFNQDGLMDFVANGNSTAINVFINDGLGGFRRSVITGSGNGRGLDVADVDADGHLDFVRAAYGNNDLWLYRGDGAGAFTATKVGTATGSSSDNYAVAAADFDNDGKVDVIVGGSSNGNPYFFRGNGDGSFQLPVEVATLDNGTHNAIGAYDLNNDGNMDVVMATYSNRSLRFYPGVGDGTFGAAVTISTSATTTNVLAISAPPKGNPYGYPVAAAEPASQTISLGETANLDGSWSYDPDGSITAHDWSFGDGTTAADATVSHLYANEGRFGAALTVTDNSGKKATDVAGVVVLGNPPSADAGGPYLVGEAQASNGRYAVSFDGSASSDDFGIVSYEWDFGDGLADDFNDGDALGWSVPIAGSWAVNSGAYEQTNASPDRTDTFIGDLKAGDYTIEADVMLLSGSGQEAQILFRVQDANNHYEFIFRGRGINDILLYRQLNGGFAQIAATDLGFAPQLNTWYHLKIEAYGSNIKLYINDSLFLEVNDANFASGKVGFSTYRTAAKFDNLQVYSLGTGVSPTHLYAEGSYTAALRVTDAAGQTATATAQVTAAKSAPPVANPGGPYVADETAANQNKWTVALNGSASWDDVGIESYSWNFGDGSALGTTQSPTHVYAGAGIYTVTLTVTDRAGQSHAATTTVTTKGNAFPEANPGGPYTVNEEQVVNKHWSVNVDAAASNDDVGIWKYSWSFGDGTAAVTTPQATHEYAIPGTYTITLTVTDHANQAHTASTSASVVATAAPTASAGGPYAGEPNTPVQLDGSASTDNTGILAYVWDFGDGTVGKGVRPVHAYSLPGTYTVSLTVTDTALLTATATATAAVAVGSPPVANAGGPYFSNVGVPVRLNASASTDDFGIAAYNWAVGTANVLLEDNFTGTVIDAVKWLFPAAGVTQNEAVTLTGSSGWGSRYLFSKGDFALDGTAVFTGQIKQTAGGHLMFGFKDTSTNYSYTQMPYALYFDNGTLRIYESGSNRATVGSYSLSVLYDAKVELKMSGSGSVAGARYYYKPASSATWVLLYDSSYVPASSNLKAGVSYYSGTWLVDNFRLTTGAFYVTGEKPVVVPVSSGIHPVQLTVTDGAGQSSTTATTLTVVSDPLVITAPWQFSGGIEIPHDTWSGEEVILKAVAKSGTAPLTYVWDFGDGTSSMPTAVTDSYNLAAKHVYTAGDGTPITARVTVTDADGRTASDTFPIIIRAKTLDVEVNKAIDDALWYIHTQQNRSNGSWRSSGWTTGFYASPTASAIHAMQINGHLEVGDFSSDPYVEDVWAGMDYVLKSLRQANIGEQAYGNPDINGNGIGVETIESDPIYQGGQLMMALVASGTPAMKTSVGGTGIIGRTYRDIVEDMAEMYYWGQGDDVSGYGAGGWRYSWQGQADNSACQWAALGFEAAEEQGWIDVPQWVKDRNLVWLDYSRGSGGVGYGYTGSGNGEATSPSGLAQVAFNGIPTSDDRWKKTENDLAAKWNSWYNGSGNYYAFYALAKAMRIAKPQEVVVMSEGTANAIDWYNDPTRGLARMIVNQQDADGRFTGGGGTKWVENDFRTAWGVIILTKTLFVLPPVADAGDNRVWGVDWELTFDGSRSYHLDPFRQIVKYEWDFDGDGVYDASSDQPTAVHIYSSADYPVSTLPRTFSANLRVTDNNDPPKSDTDTVTIIIAEPPHPPVADPGGPYFGYVGIPLQLDGSGSYDIDPSDLITSYGWETDGIFPYGFDDATGAKPMVTMSAAGIYNIGLQVYDNGVLSPGNEKLSDTSWTTLTIQANNPPVADAGGPYTVNEGSGITLNAGGSSDPDGNPLIYAWDLDNDGTFETAGVAASFSRPDNGIFTVGLKVYDGALEAVTTTTVTVENVAPLVNPLPPASFNEGGSYNANGAFSDPGADSWTATVDYGDGGGAQALTLHPDKTFQLSHLYPQNGSYPVIVVVTDDDGGSAEVTTTATVLNVAPQVDAGPDATLIDTRSFAGSGSFTDPGVEDVWTATVDYGDGSGPQPLPLNPDKTFALAHDYSSNGIFTVTVTVSDADGGGGSDNVVVRINNQAPEVDAGPDVSINEGGTFNSGGSFSDPSSASWTATVDYGDGSGPQPLTLIGNTFNLSHAYGQNGTYIVTVRVTDEEGGTGSDTAVVTVNNVAPTVNAGPNATIDEGGAFSSAGSFADPGADTWTATVNYGDGSGNQPLALNGDKTFALNHVYTQDGLYTVTVTVTDSDGAPGSDTAVVTVNNVAPTVNAGPDATIDAGGAFISAGFFADPGADTWTATVNYGDGSGNQPLALNGDKTFSLGHVYATPASYTVTVTVTDNGGASGADTAVVTVRAVVSTKCDIDGDGDVDKLDTALISRARGQRATVNDPRDSDGDGLITPNDVKVCIPQCTRPYCAIQ